MDTITLWYDLEVVVSAAESVVTSPSVKHHILILDTNHSKEHHCWTSMATLARQAEAVVICWRFNKVRKRHKIEATPIAWTLHCFALRRHALTLVTSSIERAVTSRCCCCCALRRWTEPTSLSPQKQTGDKKLSSQKNATKITSHTADLCCLLNFTYSLTAEVKT